MTMTNRTRAGSMLIAGGGIAAGLLALAGGPTGVRRYVRRLRDDHRNRPALWNRFYALDWGDTTTNNYGFAPAEGDDPQRFQHQMYREMLGLLPERLTQAGKHVDLLEVSCGRGGGLNAFVAAAPMPVRATGLDVAHSAVDFCKRQYATAKDRSFVQGDAMALPFADASFDVVLNVEASNDYPDRAAFFREVARVLRPDGVFLYAESFRTGRVEAARKDLTDAGFKAEFRDVTQNVVDACRADTPRRLKVIDRAPLAVRLFFKRQLGNYAAIESSDKFQAFVDGRRKYLMTAATRG